MGRTGLHWVEEGGGGVNWYFSSGELEQLEAEWQLGENELDEGETTGYVQKFHNSVNANWCMRNRIML